MIKPADLALEEGDKHKFKISGPHKVNDNGLFSIPVSEKVQEKDHFGLNKTNLRTLANVLGHDSDAWDKASFEALVVKANNPQSKAQVLSWKIIEKSIVSKK